MDIISLIKTLFIGCLGAGGYYFVASFVYHYFPMPLLTKMRDLLVAWGSKKYREEKDLAQRKEKNWVDYLWKWGSSMLIFLIIISWLVTFGIYAYGLHQALTLYLSPSNFFWAYYGISICFPAIWVLVISYRFIKPKKEILPIEVEKSSNESLLKQMIQ